MTFGRSLVLLLSLYVAQISAFTSHKLPGPRAVGVRGRTSLTREFAPIGAVAPWAQPQAAPTVQKAEPARPDTPLHTGFPTRSNPVLVVSLLGGLLCLGSGYLNAVCLLMLGRTSTHVTGLMTFASNALIDSNNRLFMEHCFQLFTFFAGAVTSSIMVGGRQKMQGGQEYTSVMAAIAACVGLAAFLSSNAYLALICVTFAAGMKNAMTTFYSGAIIRCSHITGTLTDIGTEAAQLLKGRIDHAWKFTVLCAFTMFFFVGGCLGTVVAASMSPALALVYASLGYTALATANGLFHAGKLRWIKRASNAAWNAIWNP